ncbi:MAG: alpha/beta fold hydrolase [Nocardioides sp.]|nr:alpha/beta fold hydrolase [Nocardioides sp.]
MAPDPDRSYSTSEETFDSQGTTCAARVYRSTSAASSRPVVVMAHGFGGVRGLRLYAYAERFAAAGYAVVVFDYRGFGDSAGEPRQLLAVRMQHQDWRAALAFARQLPDVDPARVIAWGTSFSGGHVITLAGQGEPLAAIIAQVPHVSGPAAVRATGLRRGLRVGPHGVRDLLGSCLGRAPVYVPSVAHPGATGVMTSPDAMPGMDRLLAESGLTRDDVPVEVAARIAVLIGLYSPSRWAGGVTCPALVQIAAEDSITPPRVAEAAAAKMRQATVCTYPGGHFDPYVEPLFPTVVGDQLGFLQRNVPVGPA